MFRTELINMSTIIKRLLRCCIAICICLIWNEHVLSQELEIKVFNKEYEQCKSDFDDLYKIPSSSHNQAAKLLLDGKPFTGCAKSSMNANNSPEYFICHAQDGYATRQLFYYNNGDLSREFNFRGGRSHGLHVMYHTNGSKYIEEFYNNGTPIGTHCRWHKNGQLARKAIYNMGLKISERLYDKAGNLIDK